jgi:hypothetical protein
MKKRPRDARERACGNDVSPYFLVRQTVTPLYLASGSVERARCNCRFCRGLLSSTSRRSPEDADRCDLGLQLWQRWCEKNGDFGGFFKAL